MPTGPLAPGAPEPELRSNFYTGLKSKAALGPSFSSFPAQAGIAAARDRGVAGGVARQQLPALLVPRTPPGPASAPTGSSGTTGGRAGSCLHDAAAPLSNGIRLRSPPPLGWGPSARSLLGVVVRGVGPAPHPRCLPWGAGAAGTTALRGQRGGRGLPSLSSAPPSARRDWTGGAGAMERLLLLVLLVCAPRPLCPARAGGW